MYECSEIVSFFTPDKAKELSLYLWYQANDREDLLEDVLTRHDCAQMLIQILFKGSYGEPYMQTNLNLKISSLLAKMMEVKPGVIVSAQEAEGYPRDRVVVLATGAQGEEFAALMRMATDKHKFITLDERDTIVLSSSVIPGNEVAVQILKDNIYRKNVRIMNYKTQGGVHSSGHGNAGELRWVRQTVKPKFLSGSK